MKGRTYFSGVAAFSLALIFNIAANARSRGITYYYLDGKKFVAVTLFSTCSEGVNSPCYYSPPGSVHDYPLYRRANLSMPLLRP